VPALKSVPVPPLPEPTHVFRVRDAGGWRGVSSTPQNIAQGEKELTPLTRVTVPGVPPLAALARVLFVRWDIQLPVLQLARKSFV